MAMPMITLLIILLALTPLSKSKVFESIDCGSNSDSYTDPNSIKWIGDKSLIGEGESYTVKFDPLNWIVPMRTLRAFTAGILNKKYCYSIDAEKGGKVLLRASFLYANYDGKSSPPTFELYADGNLWGTVSFTAVDTPVMMEAIYSPKRDRISVCVAQTYAGQFPFISSIEVRSVEPEMYSHVDANRALLSRHRYAFGAAGPSAIRYPYDAYDRLWIPFQSVNVKNEAPSITIDAEDNPPEIVLRNAVTGLFPSQPLENSIPITDTTTNIPVYINLFFSEVTPLNSFLKRSFVVVVGDQFKSEPIIPPYGSVLQITVANVTASLRTRLALVPTRDSTLPPLINAIEVYHVSDPLIGETESQETVTNSDINNPVTCSSSKSCDEGNRSVMRPRTSIGVKRESYGLGIVVLMISIFFAFFDY